MSAELRITWRDLLSHELTRKVAAAAEEGREVTMGELSDAVIDFFRLDEHRHMVCFTGQGWTIQHPMEERITGALLDCEVHTTHGHLLVSVPPEGPGVYWIEGDRLVKT